MEPRVPRYMTDAERLELAIGLMDEAYTALCWIGCDRHAVLGVIRPARIDKSILKLDKAITALEKHQDGTL